MLHRLCCRALSTPVAVTVSEAAVMLPLVVGCVRL